MISDAQIRTKSRHEGSSLRPPFRGGRVGSPPLTEPPTPGQLRPYALLSGFSFVKLPSCLGVSLGPPLVSPPRPQQPPSSYPSVCLSASHSTSSLCLCLCLSLSPLCLGPFNSLRPPPTPLHPSPPQVCLSLPQWLQWFGQAQLPSAQMTSLPHHTHAHMPSMSHTSTHRCKWHTHTPKHAHTHTHTNTLCSLAGPHCPSEGPRPAPIYLARSWERMRPQPGLRKADSARNPAAYTLPGLCQAAPQPPPLHRLPPPPAAPAPRMALGWPRWTSHLRCSPPSPLPSVKAANLGLGAGDLGPAGSATKTPGDPGLVPQFPPL